MGLFAEEELEELQLVIREEILNLELTEQKAKMSGAGVKEAMAYFLARNNIGYLHKWSSYPKCPVRKDEINCGLVISQPDEEGDYQWKPLEQNMPIDFESIESKLGFSLHTDIKALVSSYFYFMLEASIEDGSMYIYPFLPTTNIEEHVIGGFEKESYAGDYDLIINGQFFSLGGTCIGGDDSFILEVNNENGEVLAVEYMDKRYIKIADSLYDLFMNSRPIYYRPI